MAQGKGLMEASRIPRAVCPGKGFSGASALADGAARHQAQVPAAGGDGNPGGFLAP